ncbi:MAG: N-acyl-D-amino-acid deacylase family protein, partial [Ilumatobacteraceae bacterium]
MHDLVIRGGTLVDGTGSPAVVADVAVTGGVIVAVGENLGHASRTVDADGALVTPGFVDVHTHYDAQASWDPYLTPSSWHGVTTAVMGNCGVGFAPAAPDRHEWLIELMEGVEDIPGAALTDGIDWQWETFPQYLDALDARRYAIDIAAQVPHGALRAYVMGDRGAANESATDADIAEMARLVAEGLSAGALGFTTSRTPLHRSRSGELVPGTTADAAELMGIASAMPHGVVQFAPYHPDVPTSEWQWMRELAAATGRTVSVNLNQPDQHPEVWRDVLARLDEAIADNVPIVAQVGGRGVGLLMCLEGSYHPLMFHPVWAEIAHLTHAEQVAALREPERRHRLITEMPDDGGLFERAALGAMWKIWAVDRADIDYEPLPDDSLAARATREGRPAIELALDQLLSDDGRGFLYSTFFSYSYGDLSFIHDAQLHPGTRMGLADAGAHCRVICDGGMPTFMLTHW